MRLQSLTLIAALVAKVMIDAMAQEFDLAANMTQRQILGRAIEVAKGNESGNMMILAFEGIDFSLETLNNSLDSGPSDRPAGDYGIWHRETSDFAIIELVRIMIFSGKYNDTIIPVLQRIPFWMNYGESVRCYWSENHMSMWMTSSQLLHEHFGYALPDSNHRQRLVEYLEVHRDFGYYEFLSTTYTRFTLGGLLNLYDFTFDQELKDLAEACINRMIIDLLRVVTPAGTIFPISGRSGNGHFMGNPFGGSLQKLIGILTGLGPFPTNIDGGAAFVATTSFNFTSALSTYSATVNTPFDIGMSLEQQDTILADQEYFDKIVFQWSQGAYFGAESDIAVNTFENIKHFDMWESRFFKDYKDLSFLPSSIAGAGAAVLESFSGSSLLYGDSQIYRHKNAMMTSMQEYFPGLKGYQQQVLIATTGLNTVFPQGGKPDPTFDRPSLTVHPQLPSVKQVDNVASILFNPHPDLYLFADVDGINLYFPEADFDDVAESGKWVVAREDQAYVAVYRACLSKVDDLLHCTETKQHWVMVVGHEDTHGNFSDFQQTIASSLVSSSQAGTCIEASSNVDGVSISGHELCSPLLGPIGVVALLGSLLIFMLIICCFLCCRKKRRLWKKFHSGTKERFGNVKAVVLSGTKEKPTKTGSTGSETISKHDL